MKKLLLFVFIFSIYLVPAQSELVFVYFKDKPNKAAFYANPLSELTQKSLDRRAKFGISLNDQDAPIEPTYLQNIRDLGYTVTDYSKWMNGVAVNATALQIADLMTKPYVNSVERFIKHGSTAKKTAKKVNKFELFNQSITASNFNYGYGLSQIDQVNLRPLHVSGFTGSGITIAVIDSGFPHVDTGSVYARIRNNGQIKGGYNFIHKSTDIYNTSLNAHGSYCLGVIASYVQDNFVGSAPDADFYLYATEDANNEIPEEQLYWTEAAEEADRKGVDLISTSLGYYDFDDSRYNLLYADMNGKTSFIARAAQITTEKGIFVVAAAGNEALKYWHYMVTPGDNEKVFTIGGVTPTGDSSSFSSFGPNAEGKIKPDAVARGTQTFMGFNNSVTSGNGTSFATPLSAGGIACLMQALPNKSITFLSDILRQNASLYPTSDNQKGYGILDFSKSLNTALLVDEKDSNSKIQIYPNPVLTQLTIKSSRKIIAVELFDTLGRKLKNLPTQNTINMENYTKGVYFLKVQTDHGQHVEKIIKQ